MTITIRRFRWDLLVIEAISNNGFRIHWGLSGLDSKDDSIGYHHFWIDRVGVRTLSKGPTDHLFHHCRFQIPDWQHNHIRETKIQTDTQKNEKSICKPVHAHAFIVKFLVVVIYLLELLLRSQLVRMSTSTFPTVGSTGRKTSVTFATNHFLAVVFWCKSFKRGLNNTTTETTR